MENKNVTLVVLAAGMGSRFGGLKQIEPVGPNDEFIIDYSVYDAILAGFTKIIFLIKEENYEVFKQTIGKRVEPHIKVEYCFQKNDNLPKGYEELKNREKPLGTAHAILCCKDKINEPFAIINADDFYGRDAYQKAYQFLVENKPSNPEKYGLIGYLVKNTMTEVGAVKRGVCEVKRHKLERITESKVEKKDGKIIATSLETNEQFIVDENQTVSMNMLLFNPSIFDYIEKKFPIFLENHKNILDTYEYLIPTVLFESIKEGFATVDVIMTTANWHGVTYREDLEDVKKAISLLIDKKEYNKHLWK